ncbi:hypothetical protein BGZ52_007938, partial [Haplosporangium bisporale]
FAIVLTIRQRIFDVNVQIITCHPRFQLLLTIDAGNLRVRAAQDSNFFSNKPHIPFAQTLHVLNHLVATMGNPFAIIDHLPRATHSTCL